ncbi:MAG: 3-deoxy-D-manno-octulosonic acid transferase [Candidatus Omnitrophica bacterium]|nr:3-deoxy-D-manno-octulosonic acid transferase [Candidatus Omnitrophota bacterium]
MTIYDVFFLVFSIIYLPYLAIKGKAHRDFRERFGKLPSLFKEISSRRPIWVHAVSVGEVLAAKNFVEMLSTKFPDRKIVLSTTTKTGNTVARKILKGDILKFYFPLDFSFVVKRVVNTINPSILIIMETEVWPNLILELSRRKIPIMLINGRISDRSFKGYRKITFFFNKIIKKMSCFCMQTKIDAERIKTLGAPETSVRVTGNMKFDVEASKDSGRRHEVNKSDLGITESDELIIAGSTHGGEEEIVLETYNKLTRKFTNLRILIAPRHIDRVGTIKRLVEQKGFEGVLLSRFRKGPKKSVSKKAVLILDTLGELSQLYSLATIVFMGGSLVKRGGHNIVEPAMFGTPIVFGPYMHNFRDMARLFLEREAAMKVKDRDELLETLETLLRDENKRNVLGRNAKELINKSKGATSRNLREVTELI